MPDIMLRLGQEVLVAEGAMGTMLQRYGMPAGACPDQFNEIDPETVEQVHRLYHLAGANCAITNTFGATKAKLQSFDIEMRADRINRDGVKIARTCRPEHILGDIGPCGLVMAPAGDASFDDLFEQYRTQAQSLAAENPDALLIETMIDIADARCAVLACKSACDLPVFVTCTFNERGVMPLSGTDPATAAVALEACGADAVGLNCGFGPDTAYPLLQAMAEATSLPLIVQPNAGVPVTNRRGEVSYSATPDDFATWAVRFADAGAAIIGSCCGSSPAYTGAISAMVMGRRVKPHGALRSDQSVVCGPRKRVTLGGTGEVMRIARVAARFAGTPDADEATASDFVADALDELAEDAGLVWMDASLPAASDERAIEAVVEAANSSGAPFVIGFARAASLERALSQAPGRMVVDTAALKPEEGGSAHALELAARYGAQVLLRARSAGPECDADQAIRFIDDRLSEAFELGLRPADVIVDVATGRAGDVSRDAALEVLGHVHESGCLALLDTTAAPRRTANPAKRLQLLSDILAERLDAVICDAGDEAVEEALHNL